jgi:hypothetical protein
MGMTGQLLAFVLLLMAAVAPGGAHTGNANVVASAIAYVVDHDPLMGQASVGRCAGGDGVQREPVPRGRAWPGAL